MDKEKEDVGKKVEVARESYQEFRESFRDYSNSHWPYKPELVSDLFDAYIKDNSRKRMETFADNYQMSFSQVEKIMNDFGLPITEDIKVIA